MSETLDPTIHTSFFSREEFDKNPMLLANPYAREWLIKDIFCKNEPLETKKDNADEVLMELVEVFYDEAERKHVKPKFLCSQARRLTFMQRVVGTASVPEPVFGWKLLVYKLHKEEAPKSESGLCAVVLEGGDLCWLVKDTPKPKHVVEPEDLPDRHFIDASTAEEAILYFDLYEKRFEQILTNK